MIRRGNCLHCCCCNMFSRVICLLRSPVIKQMLAPTTVAIRPLSVSSIRWCENHATPAVDGPKKPTKVRGTIDRSTPVPVETSMKYMESSAYQEAYGDSAVWSLYRRNHKGMFAPKKTRKTCIRGGFISTGNPCPICRDEYLVLDYRNVKLLEQFISEDEVLSYRKTGLCQKRHLELLVAVRKAMDHGFLTYDVPFRHYNYEDYYDLKTGQSKV